MLPMFEIQLPGPTRLALGGLAIIVLTYLAKCVYLLFFHPLAKYPGPPLATISGIWRLWASTSYDYVHRMQEWHRKYGDVIRIGPNKLSFATVQAYRDIYGHVSPGKKRFIKSAWYEQGEPRITTVRDPAEHARQRKLLSHAFSTQALRDQEGVVQQYADLLIQQVDKFGAGGAKALNAPDVYNWYTFDVIGDLAFGEAFGALAQGSNAWVSMILDSTRFGSITKLARNSIFLGLVSPLLFPDLKELEEKHTKHWDLSRAKARKRIQQGSTGRQDFFDHLIRNNEMREDALMGNAQILILAGSETTATALSGITFHLLKNPAWLARLADEVRTAFAASSASSAAAEITGDSTASLPVLHGVIEEGMRLFPPVALGLPRDCPGAVIDGRYVPAGVEVSVENYCLAHDARYWADPESFRPDRWIGAGLGGDDRRASQPFSMGPRACLGVNLAYLEMRITLAKIVFAYDLELVSREIEDWNRACKCFGLWKKATLLVKFHPRQQVVSSESS